ncbi:hypothetical protein LZC95_22745 [Pendulispora brunnea]|uniref:CHAT domain-containing protein n=1 Tax=Pendulispora brunnea TaxID=2905690 RepID=A0ABZ2KTJ6_9BACT
MKDLDTELSELDELFDTELEEHEKGPSSCGCGCKRQKPTNESEELESDSETGKRPGCVGLVHGQCPPEGTPFEVLDQFAFNVARIDRVRHPPKLERVARTIAASQRTANPIRKVLLVGYTDQVGKDVVNIPLGQNRASEALDALCALLERTKPGLSRSIEFIIASCGSQRRKATPPKSRRVEIFLPIPRKSQPKRNEGQSCGVPARPALLREIEQESGRARVTTQPRLCLFMNAGERSHRNHFQCGASRQATRISAVASPTGANCRRRIGATSYDTGADIIRSIESARACLGRPVDAVHVFSHGFGQGIPGTTTGSAGLYRNGYPGVDRADGGRTLSDLPTAALANNVTFVLHGCNLGSGDENFARSLYQRLRAGSLTNPKVLAHRNGGCAGRDDSWREYSNAHPNGRNVAPLRNLASTGCCSS